MRYDIHNKENTETNLHFMLCMFGVGPKDLGTPAHFE